MRLAAIVLLVASAGMAADIQDPWAASASVEPWPLIASLQRYTAAGEPALDWERAVRHEDPIVRAAAAAAMGRVPAVARRADLDALLADRIALVRHTAQWAALQQPGEPTVELVSQILSEPWPHHAILARLRLPVTANMSVAQRREWLRGLPPGPLRLPPRETPGEAPLDRVTISTSRSEYDADEVVDLDVRIIACDARRPSTLTAPTVMVPRDPWLGLRPYGPERDPSQKASVDVTVRIVGGDGTGQIALTPSRDRVVRLALDLEELSPDVYVFTFGNPLFLRVRRSAEQESRGREASRDPTASDEALATVSRLRMRVAAPALRRHFSDSLAAHGYGFNTWRDTVALARLAGRESADLVIPPLLSIQGFLDPYSSQPPDLVWFFTTAFEGEARTRLEAFVSGWREAQEHGFDDALSRLFADPSYGPGSAVDAARLEVLTQLGSLYDTNVVSDYQARNLLEAALTGAAGDHPEAVASVLSRAAPRSASLAQTLHRLTQTLSFAATDRLVRALADALPATASDARAAVAAEAERLGVSLSQTASVNPSAAEVERQLRQAFEYGATPAQVDRAIARGRELLARERSSTVALLAAEAEMARGRWEEAAQVAPDPATMPTDPHAGDARKRAHRVRGRVAAARGRLVEAAQELSASGHQDFTKALAERIAAVGPEEEGRVRFLPLPSITGQQLTWTGRAFGRYVFSTWEPNEVRRFDPATLSTLAVGRAPAAIRAWSPVAETIVVAMGAREVWRLEAERSAPTWTVPIAPSSPDPLTLAADASVTIVKDGAGLLRAWSTDVPARGVWQMERVAHLVLVSGTGVLVAQSAAERKRGPNGCCLTPEVTLRLVDASGSERWAVLLPGNPDRIAVGGSLVVLWGPNDVMTAYDLGDGRRLWARDFHEPGHWLTGNNVIEYVVALDGVRVYLRNRADLLGLSPEDGRTLWTVPFAQRRGEAAGLYLTDQKLIPVQEGAVWWLGQLAAPAASSAERLVDRNGVVLLNPPVLREREAATVLLDGTLLVRSRYGGFLEVWSPR